MILILFIVHKINYVLVSVKWFLLHKMTIIKIKKSACWYIRFKQTRKQKQSILLAIVSMKIVQRQLILLQENVLLNKICTLCIFAQHQHTHKGRLQTWDRHRNWFELEFNVSNSFRRTVWNYLLFTFRSGKCIRSADKIRSWFVFGAFASHSDK